ncbi:hypothetical protein MD535_25635 [Vibrio sp. ZSDZ65]|uniref:Uncharacterized protein n=1 Tax=Vibrio qingdaonensis TaxID=2829491 RepID=A0A9X3CTR5_9VIBR|nr:hypothetical protein [Vibrio qingdaonensis]MCW8349360.1 hypothetical protein [Vibrio qingdaonensis]
MERDIEFDFIHSTVFTRYSGIKACPLPTSSSFMPYGNQHSSRTLERASTT